MMVLRGHKGAVTGLAFSPDGRQLASSSRDCTVRIWDTFGTENYRLNEPDPALCVAWSNDGLQIGTGDDHGHVGWWRAPQWAARQSLMFHVGGCHSIAFGLDGEVFSSGWNEVMRHELSRVQHRESSDFDGAIDRMTLDAGGQPLVITETGDLYQFTRDLSSFISVSRGFSTGQHTAIICSGKQVAFAAGLHIGLWSGRSRQLPRTWQAHEEQIRALTFLPGGQSLWSAGLDGLVKRWELTDFTALAVHDFGVGDCYSLAVSPDGLLAAVGGLEDIVVWDLAE